MLHDNPVAALGHAALLLSMVAAGYTTAASVATPPASAAAPRRGSKRLVRSGIQAAYGTTALITFSSAIMFFLLLSNDYSVKYVQRHSDASMPWWYKLTSFWGGLDGSIMWWVFLLAVFSAIAIYVNRERHRELIPWVTAILFTVVAFFLMLLISEQPRFFWFANTGVFSEDTTGQDLPDTRLQLDDTKHHSPQIGQNVDLWVV